MRQSTASVRNERGAALLWSLMTVLVVALLGVAAYYLSSQDRLIGENFENGYRASYSADNALSEYYARFVPASDLTLAPVESDVVDQDSVLCGGTTSNCEADDEGAVDSASGEYDGADLTYTSFGVAGGTVWVTPTKAIESRDGDVYMLEAIAQLNDVRHRPASTRSVRTFGQLTSPVKVYAALEAPNGVNVQPPADHFHLDGSKKKTKCGNGTHVGAIAAPSGTATINSKVKKVHLMPDADAVDTNSTDTYQELKDSMGVDWTLLSNPASFNGLTNIIKVPTDYASLGAIPFNTMKKNTLWPIVHVNGDVNISAADVKGWGMLIITGALNVTGHKLDWRGLILTGKPVTVSGTAHLHSRGMMATGLACTAAELANAAGVPPYCQNQFTGAHWGVKYEQCDLEAAWSQLLVLRPLTPSRHSTLF
jgi:hypothetical protein